MGGDYFFVGNYFQVVKLLRAGMIKLLSNGMVLSLLSGSSFGQCIFSKEGFTFLAILSFFYFHSGLAYAQEQVPEAPFNLAATVTTGEVSLTWKNPTAAKNLKIAFIGSSTTAGTGATPGMGYVSVVTKYYKSFYPNYESVNKGVGGYTSYLLLPTGSPRVPNRPAPDTVHNITAVLKTNPNLVVCNLPSNDVANNYTSEEFINNLKAIRAAAEAAGVPIFFTTTQPRNFDNLSQRQKLQDQAALIRSAFGPWVIDIYDELTYLSNLTIKPEYGSGDGVHLNNAGHAYLASTLAGVVDAFLSATLFPTAAGITDIEIYRALEGGQLTLLAGVGGQSTGYTDNAVLGGNNYRYALKGVKDTVRSEFSNEVTVSVPHAPPTLASFAPSTGRVGAEVSISGSELASVTVVLFNGISASFSVISNTQIDVIVPPGATTGPVTITTRGGSAISGSGFTVVSEPALEYEWRPQGNQVSAFYTDQANWSPPRKEASPGDILLFNLGDSTVATNVPTESVARLVVSNGTVLTLVPQKHNTLTLVGSEPGPELVVEPNAVLRLHAHVNNRSLSINFPKGSKGFISGRVVFTSANGYNNVPHRLLADQSAAITFFGNATFVAEKFAGSPFGNAGTPNTVIFRPGATYVAQAGGNPFGLEQPASKVVFDRQSIFLLQHTDDPSFAGRTYGDLKVNLSQVTGEKEIRVGIGSPIPNPFKVNNFSILSGTVSFPLNINNQPLPVHLLGSLTVATGATMDFSPVAAAAASVFSFIGDTAPVIGGQGTLRFGENTTLRINTPLDQEGISRVPVTLNRSLTLAGGLDLAQGVLLIPSLLHTLTVAPGQTVTGGNANSFVQGNLARTASAGTPTILYFPVGAVKQEKGHKVFRPLTLQVTSSQATAFTTRQIEEAPATREMPFRENDEPSIDRVSEVRYYTILKQNNEAAVAEGAIILSFGADDGVTDPASLRIANSNATGWIDYGGTATASGTSPFRGTITAPLRDGTAFGDFVLANVSSGQNPLPVELIHFSAIQVQGAGLLRWSTATERSNRGFDIERSPDGAEWERIGFLAGHGNSQHLREYQFADQKIPALRAVYYRLKQLNEDGTFAYSRIVAVQLSARENSLDLYPNPVVDELHLRLGLPSLDVRLRIINLLGQILAEKLHSAGQTEIVENVSLLPSGVYQAEIINGQERTFRKFVKISP